jgi:phosphoglycolate phosphatase
MKAKETILIGDSIYDFQGAMACGISFLGVTYGFGFHADVKDEDIDMCCAPQEILKALGELHLCG